MKFHDYLRELMKQRGLTQMDLKNRMSISQAAAYYLTSGTRKPPKPDAMAKLCDALNCTPAEREKLMSYAIKRVLGNHAAPKLEDIYVPKKGFTMIPILGSCPESPKSWVDEDVEEWEELPEKIVKGRRMYLLKAKGDSMNDAGIDDGDLILVDADAEPRNGSIVVTCVDRQFLVRKFYKKDRTITLNPDSKNKEHHPTTFDSTADIKLRGVVDLIYLKKLNHD